MFDAGERELLLAHLLGVDQAHLLAHPPKLTPLQRWRYNRLLRKRSAGWPVAYLTGEKWFYGRKFEVNPDVLIPRPETELLVDVALDTYRRLGHPQIIDVGSGSGCIAVTLAAELDIPIVATDVSRRALAVARRNARRHNVKNLVTFYRGHLLNPIRKTNNEKRQTIIVANLPYLPADHSLDQTPREPTHALYGGGTDGLDLIRALVDQCRGAKFCAPTAVILEIDPRQAAAVRDLLAREMPDGTVTIHLDLAGLPRVATWSRMQ